MIYFIGLHNLGLTFYFEQFCVSRHILNQRLVPRWLQRGEKDAAKKHWILDSGAYTELNKYGQWQITPQEYAKVVNLWQPSFFITMDYPCTQAVAKKTGFSIKKLQRLSLENSLELKLRYSGKSKLVPVLQGISADHYLFHLESYLKAGFAGDALYAVGSLSNRQRKVAMVEKILKAIKKMVPAIKLHGLGLKITSLRSPAVSRSLYAADSMAWSFEGRRRISDKLCSKDCLTPGKNNCRNCRRYARYWLEKLMSQNSDIL